MEEKTKSKIRAAIIRKVFEKKIENFRDYKCGKIKAKANENGQYLEDAVLEAFDEIGIMSYEYKDYDSSNCPSNYVLKKVPTRVLWSVLNGDTSARMTGRGEFVIRLIVPHGGIPLFRGAKEGETVEIRIECKYQGSSGTCSEKLLYTVAQLHYAIPEKYAILLLEGPEFKKEVKTAICKICEEESLFFTKLGKPTTKVIPMNLDIFINWIIDVFKNIKPIYNLPCTFSSPAFEPETYTIQNVADKFGYTYAHIYNLSSIGRLPYPERNGRKIYYTREKVNEIATIMQNRIGADGESFTVYHHKKKKKKKKK